MSLRNPMGYLTGWDRGRLVLGALWHGSPSGVVWLPLTASIPAHYRPAKSF